ncbi:hypothetical protein BH09ACT7_BH09ACT7_38210 [soil metagenome]
MRYRLDIVAPSVIEVVRCAGGWVFDRVMAGWDVTVLVADRCDERPLQILGADTADLETALASGLSGPRPHALAVAADLYGRDSRVRDGVQRALESGQTEVTLWGDNWPAELDRVDSVEHRLSVAARAFKAQALAAASAPVDRVAFTETFRSGTPASCPVAADLVPAS